MGRLWFRKKMRQAILEGKKTSTTRPRPLKLEQYQAVGGSRYKAVPFAIIRIQDILPTTWDYVARFRYQQEGFDSKEEMLEYGRKEKLIKNVDALVYVHKFKVVKLLGA